MKKLLILIAVLSLIAGTAHAADLNDGQTRQVWAQTKGRSVVSDGSVAFRVWYNGADSAQITVSPNQVIMYENGVATTASFGTYPTIGQMVDYINSLSGWHASVGPDLYSGSLMFGDKVPILVNAAIPGFTKQTPTYVHDDSSTRRQLSAGIEATDGKFNRIKSVMSKLGTTSGTEATITLLIYDGDSIVWRKDINSTQYNTATAKDASPDTVSFVNYTDKGLSGSLGKSLVAVVSSSTAFANTTPRAADKLTDHNISIVYDQF